jgi:AraC family transcriptional regulator
MADPPREGPRQPAAGPPPAEPPTGAPDAIGRVLDRPPRLVPVTLRAETRVTERWAHGALHSHLAPMPGHVVMTYYGEDQDIVWRAGGRRLASRTRSGTITLIPDGHEGRWDIAGPIEVSHAYLGAARLQACADLLANGRRVELIGRVGFADPTAARLLELLGREAAAAGEPAASLFLEQAIDLLCIQLVRGHSSFGALAAPVPRRGLADWQVKRVTAYMREHLEREIGLDELAGLVNLSRFHFCTAFRLATGRTPHGWLTAQRIARARQLLQVPEMRVTEVGLAVGYATPSAFATSFRRLVGVTPTEFRRAL